MRLRIYLLRLALCLACCLMPLLAAKALSLKLSLTCPGLTCRLYRVGWLEAWRPQDFSHDARLTQELSEKLKAWLEEDNALW